MCGIAGLIMRAGAARAEDLQRMAGCLRHRGPEDAGHYAHENFGLAHTRLSIIDLAGGHQPLFNKAGDLALVANGEVYNFVELRAELEKLGHEFITHSDCETAVHGYAAWGRDVLRHLNGMFAIALYDRRRRELLLARDRLGIKPMYYVQLPDRFLFASEIKALLPLLPQTPQVHAPALAQFFQNQFSTGEDTAFAGVKRLLPGEAMVVRADLSTERWRYWSAADIKPRQLNYDQAVEEFEPMFDTVMREHMRSDVPYGVFLSGGVDSAVLLAALMQRHNHPIRTYSVGYANVEMRDELDDAERIAKLFKTEHTVLRLDQQAVFHRLPLSVWAADDLMRDYASLPTLSLAQRAGADLKVVFSGEGGDEAFAGYGRYRPGWFERSYKQLIAPGSGGFRVRSELQGSWVQRLFRPSLQAELARHREPFVRAWSATPGGWSDLRRRQFVDIETNLPDDLLVKADRMLMAFGVEGRVPFLDHRVIEFGLSLPDELKVSSRTGKVFLKRWAERDLPADHLWRHKRGFSVPIDQWLRGDFMARLAERLPRNRGIRDWCEPDAVNAVLERQAQKGDVSREVWSLMQFAIWHRLFIEGREQRPGPNDSPLDWVV